MSVRPVIGTPVHLLADDNAPTVQGHRQASSRQITLAGRCKDVPEFPDGTIHIEHPETSVDAAIFGDWHGLSLDDLYSREYLRYVNRGKQQHARQQLKPFPATPDFDTDMLTNSDAVATYVQNMSAGFQNPRNQVPSVLDLLNQLALEACQIAQEKNVNLENTANCSTALSTSSSSVSAVDVHVDPLGEENAFLDETTNHTNWLASCVADPVDIVVDSMEPHPFLSGDALALSLSLVDIVAQPRRGIDILLERVIHTPTAARTLSSHTVDTALDSLVDAVMKLLQEHGPFNERTSPDLSDEVMQNLVRQSELVCAVVCVRHSLLEWFRFIHLFEELTRLCGPSAPLPSAARLLEVGVLTALDQFEEELASSPFHGREDAPLAVDLAMSLRARAEHICVSRDQQHLTVVTTTGLSSFSLATPKAALRFSSDFPLTATGAAGPAPWCSLYSSDDQFLLVTNEHGTVHTVYDAATLSPHTQIVSDGVCVPLEYKNGVLQTMPAPVLPSWSRNSLLLYGRDNVPPLLSTDVKDAGCGESLVASCLLGYDFQGLFLSIHTDVTTLTLTVRDTVLFVQDGSTRSYAAFPVVRKWNKVVVQWKEYVPSVHVNGRPLTLKGEHCIRRRPAQVVSLDCFDGHCSGHIHSLSVYLRGCQATSKGRSAAAGLSTTSQASGAMVAGMSQSLSHGTGPLSGRPAMTSTVMRQTNTCVLIHLPLDEGTGMWVKEMVRRTCCALPLERVQWDVTFPVPAHTHDVGADQGSKSRLHSSLVRMDGASLLKSRVVVSDQHVYFMWPPKSMAEEGLVMRVIRSTGVMDAVYQCAGVGRDTCVALLPDESGYYALQHPLNATTFVGLHVPSARSRELLRMTSGQDRASATAPAAGSRDDPNHELRKASTIGTYLQATYAIFYGWAPVLEVPPTLTVTPSAASLLQVVQLLEKTCNADVEVLRQPALITLATSHVRRLQAHEVAPVAEALTVCAQRYSELWRDIPILHRAAEDLAMATTLKCVSVSDLVAGFLDLKNPSKHRLLGSCVSRENLAPIMRFIAEQEPERMIGLVESLVNLEEDAVMLSAPTGSGTADVHSPVAPELGPFTTFSCGSWNLFHVLAAVVAALQEVGCEGVVSALLLQRVQSATDGINGSTQSPDTDHKLMQMMLANGLIPLLLVVRDICPHALGADPAIQEKLLFLLQLVYDRFPPETTETTSPTSAVGEDAPSDKALHHSRVQFSFRETVEVVPAGDRADAAWRADLDYRGASSVTILKSGSSAAMTAVHVRPQNGVSKRFDMPAGDFATSIEGDTVIMFGRGSTSFSVIASFDLSIPRQTRLLLRETIVSVLITYAETLVHTNDPAQMLHAEPSVRTREMYVPVMLRGGLCSRTLKTHGIDIPGRGAGLPVAEEILNDTGEGTLLVDYAFSLMRGSILPSMRAAVRAMLCLLVVSGASAHQAAEELKHMWFSGDWGSKLQGETRDHTTRQLTELATWMTQAVYYDAEAASEAFRRASLTERRMEASLNESRSMSDGRGSASATSRRGTVHYSDTLEQAYTLLANGVTAAELEEILVARTRAALHYVDALQLMLKIVSLPFADAALTTVGPVLDALTLMSDHALPMHTMDTLSGAGHDVEQRLRATYHTLLARCQHVLLRQESTIDTQTKTSHHASVPTADLAMTNSTGGEEMSGTWMTGNVVVPLLTPAPMGRRLLSLFGLLCHPWDLDDCDLFATNLSNEESIMRQLQKPLSALTDRLIECCTTSAPTAQFPASLPGAALVGSDLLAAIDLSSMSRPCPNGFSVVIPQVQTSASADGTVLKKSSPKATVICADKEWPQAWRDGLPFLFYFEVRLQSVPSEIAIGLSLNARQKDLVVFYGDSGETHESPLPPFHEGDVVGCGVLPVSGQVLLTLNGHLLFVGLAPKKALSFLPAVRIGQASQVIVNFGTAPFAFDGGRLHAALDVERGPSQYLVSAMAAVTLHCVTSRVCLAHEMRRDGGGKVSLRHYCCVAVCDAVKKITASLMEMNTTNAQPATHTGDGGQVMQAVALAAAEHMVVLLIATIRRLVNGSPRVLSAFTQNESERLFETVSLLMLLPLHSIQVATLSLLAEVVQCVQTVKKPAAQQLVDVLFTYAMATHAEPESSAMVPFVPRWTDCDTRFMSITSSKTATMLPEGQRSAVIGAPLPRTGTVSFSVRITRSNMHKGHSLKGGYFIGVAVAGLTPLSPSSNSQSWKSVKPPVVWALHDISPQLSYATNPTVKPNNFQRTFGHSDVVRVVVDRDAGTVDFYREEEYLARLFSGVPTDVDIVPFAQLYNDDAEAHLIDGEMMAPLTGATLLSSVSVDVLRCMLTLEPFEELVATRLCEEMDRSSFPRVSLMVFNSLPDPRLLRLPSSLIESGTEIKVTRLVGLECKFNLDGEVHFEYLHNMRRSSRLKISCSIASDVSSANASLRGLRMCVSKLVSAARQIAVPLITTQALCYLEGEGRQRIMDEEKDHWTFLFHGVRVSSFSSVRDEISRTKALKRQVFDPPAFEPTYVFSPHLSHPGFCFSRESRYQLATVPSEKKAMSAPYIAIAEPAVPATGRFSIRCQLMRGSSGQILGGGYYFGVCTSALTWAGKDLCNSTVNVWALHDMEDTPWRLRHLLPSVVFPVVVEPRCIIVSGDIIRLEIDRTARTMSAFRKPVGGSEVALGLIYQNLPPGPLFPFVHLFNTDAVAVLLPSTAQLPAARLAVPKPCYSVVDMQPRRYCDGCYALHHECKLTGIWYKCNVCADYALCESCFSLFVHSKHTFTMMGDGSMAHSPRAPREFELGMPIVVSASPCMYLRSAACRLEEDNMWTTAHAVDDNALVIWGLTRTARTQVSITIESTDDEPLSLESPTFVGVAMADEVLPLTRKKMRAWCHDLTSEKVCFSNDATLHTPMQRENRGPYGFQSGDTISFEVNLSEGTVTVYRNWIALGVCRLQARRAVGTSTVPFVCFVAFGRPQTKATLFSEGPSTVIANVEDIKGYVVRAVTNARECVVVSKENCRLPLAQFSEVLASPQRRAAMLRKPRGRYGLGYTFINGAMTQARLENWDDAAGQLTMTIVETGETVSAPLHCFLVNESGVLALDAPMRSSLSGSVLPTMKSCFVLSRYLLILSCLCESDALSPLVTSLGADIIGILKGLASVNITKDAATDFLTDIRNTVALTAGWASYRGSEVLRSAVGSRTGSGATVVLNGDSGSSATDVHTLTFVPTLGSEERRRRFRPGMLVHILEVEDAGGAGGKSQVSALGSNEIYRVMEKRGDMIALRRFGSGGDVECHYRRCVPIKQCCGNPWFLVQNSVPCSLLEHSVRFAAVGSTAPHISTLAGMWEGSVTVKEGRAVSFRLELVNGWRGEAIFNFTNAADDGGVTSALTLAPSESASVLHVIYDYHRLERTVTLYAVPVAISNEVFQGVELDDVDRFEEAQAALRASTTWDLGDLSSQVLTLRGTLDYDGIRMDGVYKRGEDQSAAFHAKLRHHIPLVAATTRERHVEPLPSCTDAVLIPPRHREPPEVMHRLVVLLAHHLYLVLCSHSYVSWHELESALLLNDHPLTRQLVGNAIGVPQLLQLVADAANLIFSTKAKVWEAATLARLLTESFLLRNDVLQIAPRALVWDALHAVVAAAHRCGEYCRHQLVTHITVFLRQNPDAVSPPVLRQLLALLVGQLNSSGTCHSAFVEASRDNSALMELVLAAPPLIQSSLENRSLDPLKCLVALWHALSNDKPLPKAVECSTGNESVLEPPVQTECVFGDYDNDVLKVGKVVSASRACPNTRCYYEVVLPEHVPSQFSVGWGTAQHKEVPSQHVGSDAASFGFNGTDILSPKGRQEYRISNEPGTGMVIGCLLDLMEHTVAWSMNGYQGPHIPIPISMKGKVLYAFVSIGACKGMTIRMRADQFEYDPDGYTDISGRHSRPLIRNYNPLEESALPVQPLAFYWQLANHLSDAEDEKSPLLSADREASMASNNVSACTPICSMSASLPLSKYPLLRPLSVFELNDYTHVIHALESCMTTASHYVDLDGDAITGQLSQSFVFLKRFVRRQFRRKLVSMRMPYPEKRQPLTAVTVSLTELRSTLPRSPEEALQHTVLAQLHRQIGGFTDTQWLSTPLFLVHLFTSESGQAPTDAGGPYRQVWTCLADEIMTHPDRCFPHTEYHRNPLFVYVNNSQRLTLVPDTYASSPYELMLFQFFGKLMGYAARSKTPCAVDLSPFLWKFLVDDTLSIRDYYTHVNSVVENSMDDDEFLSSGVAEEVIPGFVEQIGWPKEDGLSADEVIAFRRKTAEECLIHSMDKQLKAIQAGLWSTLPRRVARCLSWSELETLVCGTADPSLAELRQCIRLQLTGPRPKYFWQILSEMTSEQKSNLLCFASGQKRLPLIRSITVSETSESVDHLPRAQSCFSIITLPKYSSYDMFKDKLLLALSHQTEMDLA